MARSRFRRWGLLVATAALLTASVSLVSSPAAGQDIVYVNQPKNIQITPRSTSADVTWAQGDGSCPATSYNIYLTAVPSGKIVKSTRVNGLEATTHEFTGLTPATSYTVNLQGAIVDHTKVDDCGFNTSPVTYATLTTTAATTSTTSSTTTSSTTTTTTTVPAGKITSLVVTTGITSTGRTAFFRWIDPGDSSITGYNFANGQSRNSSDGSWQVVYPEKVPETNASTTQLEVSPVNAGKVICGQVRPIRTNGKWSDMACTDVYSRAASLSVSGGLNNNVSVDEGDSEDTDLTFTVTLSQAAPAGGLRVPVARRTDLGGTATSSSRCASKHFSPGTADFCGLGDLPPTGVLVAAGETTATFTLSIVGDARDEPDETFYVYVMDIDGWGSGPIIKVTITDDDEPAATTTTAAAVTTTTVAKSKPAAPAGFSAARVTSGSVRLWWSDRGDDSITGFEYQQRKMVGGSWRAFSDSASIEDSDASTVSAVIDGLAANTVYRFRIRARNNRGAGPWSEVVTVSTSATTTTTVATTTTTAPVGRPGRPQGLSVNAGAGSAFLSWQALGDSTVTSWQYGYGIAPVSTITNPWTDWITIPGSDASTTSYTITGLTGDNICVWIRARNASGASPGSAVACNSVESKVASLSTPRLSVMEGDTGRVAIAFTVTLTENAPAGGLTVPVASRTDLGATATSSDDCVTLSPATADFCENNVSSVTVAAGSKTASFVWRIIGDDRVEGNETFHIHIDEQKAGTTTLKSLGWGAGPVLTVNIIDDDRATSGGGSGGSGGGGSAGGGGGGSGTVTTQPTTTTATTTTTTTTVSAAPASTALRLSIRVDPATGKIDLTWPDPGDDTIVRYEYRQRSSTSDNWTTWIPMPGSNATTTKHTLTGITSDQICIQLQAVTSNGNTIGSTDYCLNLNTGALTARNGERLALALLRLLLKLM